MNDSLLTPRDIEVSNANSSASLPEKFNIGGAREFLSQNAWPVGLQDTFVKNLPSIAFRYFICDDSGSMTTTDGSVILGAPGNKRCVSFFNMGLFIF
jgi:hypothetical protein